MAKKINIAETLKEIRTSNFIHNCNIPLGYTNGLPILQIKNDKLCVLIPYLMYKVTGEPDKTLVLPVKYTVTVSLPDRNIVAFEDLSIDPIFKNVNFSKPIGYFRHESIKKLGKNEYKEKRAELLAMYDKIASAILYGEPYSEEDDKAFRELLNIIIEPSVKPIYRALDADFCNKYFTETEK